MIIQQPWQHAFIEALRQHLYTNEDILALVVFGSAAKQMAIDLWSDVTDKPSPLWRHGQQFGGPIANLP